jgi:chromosome segregation ATPase
MSVASQLLRTKGLLSVSIDALVQDCDGVRQILEEIKPQLPEDLQIKLWPTGHLPFFRAKVEKARQRIEACRSQAPLKADIAERCRLLNKKKAALDAKTDTSAHSQRLQLLEKELEDLKAKVWATEQRIQEEKNLIASSKQEAEDLTAQLKTELTELSILSWQIVSGEDKDDECDTLGVKFVSH